MLSGVGIWSTYAARSFSSQGTPSASVEHRVFAGFTADGFSTAPTGGRLTDVWRER